MKAFTCDRFTVPLPEWHRFPMIKYARLRERIEASGLIAPEDLLIPHAATDDELLLAHDAEYVRKVVRRPALEGRGPGDRLPLDGLAGRAVEAVGRGHDRGVLAWPSTTASPSTSPGGTHHAYRDHGAGFCVFNDAAVAARVIQEEGKAPAS